MIDLEKAKQEFIKYTSGYDSNIVQIKRKIYHSLRVMEISHNLAKNIGFLPEEIELATLIGLLHDIGRFDQYTKFKTFNDLKSIDHGDEGVKILEKDKYIKNYIDNEKYELIIKKAIKNHNKYKIEENLSYEEEKFCDLIKDADKLDILYESVEAFWNDVKEKIKYEEISKEVFEQFKNQKLIGNEKKFTYLDEVVGVISFIYDINFEETLKKIQKENYINLILDRFEYNEKAEKQIQEIKIIANEYIDKKINKG